MLSTDARSVRSAIGDRRTPPASQPFTSQVALGAAVALTPVNLIKLLIGTQVLHGIVTPVVLTYFLILCNRRVAVSLAPQR
jgi:hypothetical protein